MSYVTIFDAARDGHVSWWFPVGWAVCSLWGALVVRLAQFVRPPSKPLAVKPWIFLGFLWLVSSSILLDAYGEVRSAAAALREGRYSVVAGPVTEFEMYYKGIYEGSETFVVGGTRLAISADDLWGGFHQLSSQGGPIRNGLNVRIAYSGSKILRLEVRK